MTRWTFTIPRALPSRNENTRKHWWQVKRDRARWAADLRVFKVQLGIPDATGKRAVSITRLLGKGQKFMDPRNLDDKTLVDAMLPPRVLKRGKAHVSQPGAHLLVDDSMRWAVIAVDQERAADGKPGVRITIEEVP